MATRKRNIVRWAARLGLELETRSNPTEYHFTRINEPSGTGSFHARGRDATRQAESFLLGYEAATLRYPLKMVRP